MSTKTPYLILCVFGLAVLMGCNKDTTPNLELDPEVQEVQKLVQQAVDELEADYATWNNPSDELGIRKTVVVPAGSVDALADAIAEAGPNGRVVVKSGMHFESSTVVVDIPVRIDGEDGAVISLHTEPDLAGWVLNPALHVLNTSGARISGLTIRSPQGSGNTGILVQDAPDTWLVNNEVGPHQFGVILQDSPRTRAYDNTIEGNGNIWGFIIASDFVKLKGNRVSGYSINIFIGGKRGIAYKNHASGNSGFTNFLLCTPQFYTLPDGTFLARDEKYTTHKWIVTSNTAENKGRNYVVMDGANTSKLYQNRSLNAGNHDILLNGDIPSQGFPTSADNTVISIGNYRDYRIQDCGQNNRIIGGDLIDNNTVPCAQ